MSGPTACSLRRRYFGARGIAALCALLLLCACGGDAYEGTFVGRYQGLPATVTLAQDGAALTGTVRWSGFESRVEGRVDGARATGTVRNAQTGLELPFEATADGDAIDWTYVVAVPLTGQTRRIDLALRRQGREPDASASGGSASGDPRLVGRWRRTASSGNLAGPNRPIVSTDVYSTMHADGSFVYGGAVTGVSSPSWGGVVGSGGTTRGKWKTEGQMLMAKPAGTERWLPVGRYSVSGSGMVVYPAGGQPQYWERQ